MKLQVASKEATVAEYPAGTRLPEEGAEDERKERQGPRDQTTNRGHFNQVVAILSRESRRQKRVALAVFCFGSGVLALAARLAILATETGNQELRDSNYSTNVLIFELVRTAASAALLGAFVWGLLNLARAALDQATRYEKRLVAGHFLVYVLDLFHEEIRKNAIKLSDVMEVFKTWGDSIDTAYTHVKFGSKSNQAVTFSVGKEGVTVSSGGQVTPTYSKSEPKAS